MSMNRVRAAGRKAGGFAVACVMVTVAALIVISNLLCGRIGVRHH